MHKNIEIKDSLNNISDSSIIINNPEIIKENFALKQIIEVLFGKNYESFLLEQNKSSTSLIIHLNNILKGKTIFETVKLLKDEEEKRKKLLEELHGIKNNTNEQDFIIILNEAEKLLLEFKYEEYHYILNNYDEIAYNKRNKESASINYIRAQEYKSRFQFDEAIKCCKIALERDYYYVYADFLGRIFYDKGDYGNSIIYYNKALEIGQNENIDKKYISIILTGLGLAYYDNRMNKKAIDCLTKSLEYVELEDLNTASNYNNLGLVYDNEGRYNEAVKYHFLSLKINLKLLGKNHITIAKDYNNIGNTCAHDGKYKKAINFLINSIELIKKNKSENNPLLATCYNNLGGIYLTLNKDKQSLKCYKKALKIDSETIGIYHPETAKDYGNIGKYYNKMKDYENAIKNYEMAIDIISKTLGVEHAMMATEYNNISQVYFEQGKYSIALKYLKLAYKISKMNLGNNHIDTETILKNLIICENYVKRNQIYPII